MPSTLASRQADTSGSSFGGGGDTKFAGGAPGGVSDSTSSPVPSTVGNTVGQPTPFNLGEWQTFPVSKMSSSESSKYFSFHLHGSPAPHPAARLCLFLRRSGRNARTAVRRGRGWGRGLPSHPPGYSGAHSCRSDQHHPVPEQGLRIKVRTGGR